MPTFGTFCPNPSILKVGSCPGTCNWSCHWQSSHILALQICFDQIIWMWCPLSWVQLKQFLFESSHDEQPVCKFDIFGAFDRLVHHKQTWNKPGKATTYFPQPNNLTDACHIKLGPRQSWVSDNIRIASKRRILDRICLHLRDENLSNQHDLEKKRALYESFIRLYPIVTFTRQKLAIWNIYQITNLHRIESTITH